MTAVRSLADSLRIVAPSLPSELVPEATVPELMVLAEQLPPIHRCGFECRLGAGEDGVDFQQGIPSNEDEPERLAAFLERAGRLAPAWERIQLLSERWLAPGDPVHEAVSQLWLEFDMPAAPGQSLRLRQPSAFVVLDPRHRELAPSGALAVLETLLDAQESARSASLVRRLQKSCRRGAWLSHVGVMLGRVPAALRVHISGLALSDLGGYLAHVGWRGDRIETERMARTLLDYGDSLVLCLDAVGEMTGRAGLECFFAQQHGLDPRWRALLARLEQLGLCVAEKGAALQRWPGVTTPLAAQDSWPEDLIVQSVLHPEHELGFVERRLSHVKITIRPGAPAAAKAYFGYGHLWGSARPGPASSSAGRHTMRASGKDAAIAAAVKGLVWSRNQAGWWRDFFNPERGLAARDHPAEASDEWVTAYVASALAGVRLASARQAAREAFTQLLRRRDGQSGWGYHVALPPDADSTAWVLRLAGALGESEHPQVAAGRRFIASLTRPDGGVATYSEAAGADLARLAGVGGHAGWCAAHTCVTAAAAPANPPAMTSYLEGNQTAAGSWAGYWWEDDEYATARAVEALSGHADQVRAAVAWSCERIGADGAVASSAHGGPSSFATALALRAIRVGGSPEERSRWAPVAARAERWLLDHQLEDGSWEPSAHLRIPPLFAVEPEEAPELTLRFVDERGAFTTATVLSSLSYSAV